MKKLCLSCLIALLCAFTMQAQQQLERKRSLIPFVYPEFRDAKVLQTFGRSVQAKANILLRNGALCYLEGDKILQAYTQNILGVEFDSVRYMKVDSAMGRVVAQKGYNYLLCVTRVDMDKYRAETTGGENLPFFEIDELNVFIEMQHDVRDEDKGLPLEDEYYFSIMGQVIPANESKFEKFVRPELMKQFKELMENRVWSWKEEEDLVELLDYLPEQ